MSDKWKHDNWHTKEQDEHCPFCVIEKQAKRITELEAEVLHENELFLKWRDRAETAQAEVGQLRERWLFIKSDPETARHLLLLLSWGKGTGDDFDRMLDRLIASKAKAITEAKQEDGDE